MDKITLTVPECTCGTLDCFECTTEAEAKAQAKGTRQEMEAVLGALPCADDDPCYRDECRECYPAGHCWNYRSEGCRNAAAPRALCQPCDDRAYAEHLSEKAAEDAVERYYENRMSPMEVEAAMRDADLYEAQRDGLDY